MTYTKEIAQQIAGGTYRRKLKERKLKDPLIALKKDSKYIVKDFY